MCYSWRRLPCSQNSCAAGSFLRRGVEGRESTGILTRRREARKRRKREARGQGVTISESKTLQDLCEPSRRIRFTGWATYLPRY